MSEQDRVEALRMINGTLAIKLEKAGVLIDQLYESGCLDSERESLVQDYFENS